MGIPDHLICLLRNLYTGEEATVRTGHGTTDWFQIGKGVRQGCILSACLRQFPCRATWSLNSVDWERTHAMSGANPVGLKHCEHSPHTPVIFVCSVPPSSQHD